MLHEPKVSIITTTMNLIDNNRLGSFVKCIESVHDQTYKNMEHIVIDGASLDGTLKAIKEYQENGWITIFSEPDTGIYDAMNKGIDKSGGEYIVFLNSDDCFIDRDAIAKSISLIKETEADYCYAKTIYKDEKGIVHDEIALSVPDIRNLLFYMPFCHQTMVANRKLFGERKFDVSRKSIADYEWFLYITFEGARGVFLDDYTVEFKLGGMSDRLSNYCLIQKEKEVMLYELLHSYNDNICLQDCQCIIYNHSVPDIVWNIVTSHVKYSINRGKVYHRIPVSEMLTNTYRILDKDEAIIRCLKKYNMILQNNGSIADFLLDQGISTCAIYGLGALGDCVLNDLETGKVAVKYIIDRNSAEISKKINGRIDVFGLNEENYPKVDVLIISLFYAADSIKNNLKDKFNGKMIAIDECLEMVDKMHTKEGTEI